MKIETTVLSKALAHKKRELLSSGDLYEAHEISEKQRVLDSVDGVDFAEKKRNWEAKSNSFVRDPDAMAVTFGVGGTILAGLGLTFGVGSAVHPFVGVAVGMLGGLGVGAGLGVLAEWFAIAKSERHERQGQALDEVEEVVRNFLACEVGGIAPT